MVELPTFRFGLLTWFYHAKVEYTKFNLRAAAQPVHNRLLNKVAERTKTKCPLLLRTSFCESASQSRSGATSLHISCSEENQAFMDCTCTCPPSPPPPEGPRGASQVPKPGCPNRGGEIQTNVEFPYLCLLDTKAVAFYSQLGRLLWLLSSLRQHRDLSHLSTELGCRRAWSVSVSAAYLGQDNFG